MMVWHGLNANISKISAVAIGNFDGMHLGHDSLLTQLKQFAKRKELTSVVVFFEPQPHELFSPDTAQGRLMRCRDKLEVLKQYGIDEVVVLPFNQRLAGMSANDFLQNFLLKKIKMKALLVGRDFRFGRKREGDVDFLKQQSDGVFECMIAEDFQLQGQRVSSTLVRNALEQHQLAEVKTYCGRPFSISGRVAHGAKLGKGLGFPTMNIHLHRLVPPLLGIYAVSVRGLRDDEVFGVASCGYRPVVQGKECLLEVFCFDFNKQVYGKRIEVIFHHFIREEENFDSIDDLKVQIEKDVVSVKQYFIKGK